MNCRIGFKQQYNFEYRSVESQRVLKKFPDRTPIICEKSNNSHNLPDIDKKKYLVPNELTIGQFMYVIRKRLKLNSDEAIFLFINNKIMPTTYTIGHVYFCEKDIDGFLYVQYAKENVFG